MQTRVKDVKKGEGGRRYWDCYTKQKQKNWKRVVVERDRERERERAEVFTFTSGSFCLSILTLVTDSSSKLGGEPWAAVEYTAGYSLFATLS